MLETQALGAKHRRHRLVSVSCAPSDALSFFSTHHSHARTQMLRRREGMQTLITLVNDEQPGKILGLCRKRFERRKKILKALDEKGPTR